MGFDVHDAGTSVYVVDDEYRIAYFNQELERLFPGIHEGDVCYRALNANSSPCDNCPLEQVASERLLFFNHVLQTWVQVEVGKAEWPGIGSCHVLLCRSADAADLDLKPYQLRMMRPAESRDKLTGLRNRLTFLNEASNLVGASTSGDYCLMAIDIEHFKLYNEWHGEQAGDHLLQEIARLLEKAEHDHGGIAGYFLGDDFCIVLPNDEAVIGFVQDALMAKLRQLSREMAFLPAFGLYEVDDPSLSVSAMYDRALVALSSLKGNYAQRSCWYQAGMIHEMEEDHALLQEVQRALSNGEFRFYLQPQCAMATGKVVGVESLARWFHPQRGIIYPGDFIPMLERSGLITALDMEIWEQVCHMIKSWMDKGLSPLPVSVNVSRRDIYAIDVCEVLSELVARYGIDPSLLSVEITESAYVEDAEAVSQMVDRLREAGFSIWMDDFGSGYSSLSTLKDLNVDVLKLDMKLLDSSTAHTGKSRSILESTVGMARLLDLSAVAEGVETDEQRDFLTRIGCLYAQGFGFYRPMPPDDFEQMLSQGDLVDRRGVQVESAHSLQVRKMFGDSMLSDAMIDDIMGAVAFYGVRDDQICIISANEEYARFLGMTSSELEARRSKVGANIFSDDMDDFHNAFEQAFLNAPKGAQAQIRYLRPDGTTVISGFRVFYLCERDGERIFYGALTDITDQVRSAQKLASTEQALLMSVEPAASADKVLAGLSDGNIRIATALFAQMSPGGLIGGYCEDGFPLYFANAAMVELLGYASYEEFARGIGGKVANTIHPDDRQSVMKDIGPEYYEGLEYVSTYRMPRKDGSWFWTLDKGKVVRAEDGRLAIVSACADISEVMEAQQQLAERNSRLVKQIEELTLLNEDMPGGYHRCADVPGYDFLFVSEQFLEMLGYTRQELADLFDNKFANLIHPEDRSLVAQQVAESRQNNPQGRLTAQYRMKAKGGYIWVIDQSCYLRYEGVGFLQGVITDVTEVVELREKVRRA